MRFSPIANGIPVNGWSLTYSAGVAVGRGVGLGVWVGITEGVGVGSGVAFWILAITPRSSLFLPVPNRNCTGTELLSPARLILRLVKPLSIRYSLLTSIMLARNSPASDFTVSAPIV